MKIEVSPTLTELQKSQCEIELATIATITDSLREVTFDLGPNSTAPKIISGWIKNFSHQFGWIESFRINSEIPKDLPITNYLMDGILDQYDAACGHHHRFLIQTCFDNRQAIGTNLLKFEMAQHKFCKSAKHKVLPIIICADAEVLRMLKWDSSVASSSEYELALQSGYSEILDANPILVILRK